MIYTSSRRPDRTAHLLAASAVLGIALLAGGHAAAAAASHCTDPGNPKRVEPTYPPGAIARQASGVVTVTVEVAADGSVANAELATSSGDAELDDAAVAAVREWRFEPAQCDGVPYATSGSVSVTFDLDDVEAAE
jgi:TonB family protein